MNDKLKNIIETVKKELSKEKKYVCFAKLNEGIEDKRIKDNLNISMFYEFLYECNGARCGEIDLWDINQLLRSRYRVTDIPNGEEMCVCIGQVNYEPIVINKFNGNVYRFYQGHETDIKADCFGSFDEFLSSYVFGDKYVDIVTNAENDEWYKFIKKLCIERGLN